MTDAIESARGPRKPGVLNALLLLAALVCAGLLMLGAWQIQRLGWKQALVERLDQRLQAGPVAAPGPAGWPAISRERDEYRRVQVRGHFDHQRETLVRASTVLGSGYWVLTPLRTQDGFWLLVNRGFVPTEQRPRVGGRPVSPDQGPQGEQVLEGLLRLSEPGGSFLQRNDAGSGWWYSRDVQAIAASTGLASGTDQPGPVAPYFIDVVATPGAGNWPRAGLTVLNFSNNHLVYALTWFVLALMAAGAAVYLWHSERQLRRGSRGIEIEHPAA